MALSAASPPGERVRGGGTPSGPFERSRSLSCKLVCSCRTGQYGGDTIHATEPIFEPQTSNKASFIHLDQRNSDIRGIIEDALVMRHARSAFVLRIVQHLWNIVSKVHRSTIP